MSVFEPGTRTKESFEYMDNGWQYHNHHIKGIVEYIGAKGIISSPHMATRMHKPQPGDWVDLRDWLKVQPWWDESYEYDGWNTFNAEYGRIERLNWMDDGDVHVCHNAGSAFLGMNSDRTGCYVSISGGPFGLFLQKDLEPTHLLRSGRYWNFKDDESKAHNGQYFTIQRPVFRLRVEENDERAD